VQLATTASVLLPVSLPTNASARMDGQDYTAKLTLMNVHRIPAFTAARVSTQCFRMDVFVVPGMQALTAMLTLTSVHHPRAEMVNVH